MLTALVPNALPIAGSAVVMTVPSRSVIKSAPATRRATSRAGFTLPFYNDISLSRKTLL